MKFLSRWFSLAALLSCVAFAQAESPLIVDELVCRGNAITSCDFILGHVYLLPGDRLDEEELDNARLRLSSLPNFHSVVLYLEKSGQRDHVNVVIEVAEADPYAGEWLAGTSARHDVVRELIYGRLTHQNLFGRGKLLDLWANVNLPIDSPDQRTYVARVQYVDPNWLGMKRVFFVVGASVARFEFESFDAEQSLEVGGVDLRLGRRIFDFSFVSLIYRYNAFIDSRVRLEHPDGRIERNDAAFDNHVFIASYGWNSEDDAYFPTRGSRAQVSFAWERHADGVSADGGLRKTWTTAGGTSWMIQISDTPGTEYRPAVDEQFEWSAGFARPIRGAGDGEIKRGRWYVHAGYTPLGHTLRGENQREYGLKIGLRLETRSLGIVDLYIIGSGVHTK